MNILFVIFLAIYNNGNLPKSITNFLKLGQQLPQIKYLNPQEMDKDFYDFAKVAKFRHIWSHWLTGLFTPPQNSIIGQLARFVTHYLGKVQW